MEQGATVITLQRFVHLLMKFVSVAALVNTLVLTAVYSYVSTLIILLMIISCRARCSCNDTTEICLPTDGFCLSGYPGQYKGLNCSILIGLYLECVVKCVSNKCLVETEKVALLFRKT